MDHHPAGIAALVGRGTLDAELAALVWILVEARVPVVVASPADGVRDVLLDALAELLPGNAPPRTGDGRR